MYLLASWDDMDSGIELLADDVWAAEDDKTGFLSDGVDIFDRLYLKERPIYFPMVPMSTIKPKNVINEDKWENSTNPKYEIFLWMIKIYFWLYPPSALHNSMTKLCSAFF